MTAVLVAIDYCDERENAVQQLRFAAASYRKSLANSLWEVDMPAVRLQLDGLAQFPMVGDVVLTTGIGQTIHVDAHGGPEADPDPADALSWKEVLASPSHPERTVGQLHLYADRTAFLQRIRTGAIRILAGEALKGLLLGLLISWLIARLVTRHLSDMAAQVEAMRPNALGRPLVLQRRESRYQDELDQLCGAFDKLNRQLLDHFNTQRALEEELRAHRDKLSDMVAERTRSLERLRGFHGLIIRVLTRFINLPPGDADSAIDHALAAFADYFSASSCLLMTYDHTAHGFRAVNAWPVLEGCDEACLLPDEILPRRLLADRVSRIWLCAGEDSAKDQLLTWFDAKAYTAVGVEIKGNTVGLLCLAGRAVPAGSDNAGLLELAARVSSNMLDHKAAQMTLLDTQRALQNANRELHMLSRHDPLTGMANRRHFNEVKEVEFRRALRAESPLSVLMCDLDEFKRYNDCYGHAQGDRCLVAVAQCMQPLVVRAGEMAVRMGGEEFAMLLPNVDAAQALELAERLRQAVWNANLVHAASSVADRVTISIGVASFKRDLHTDFDALMQDADLALYRAKNGRNKAVLAE